MAAGLTIAVVAAACSDGLSASAKRSELTADEVSDWFGRASEALFPCEASSKAVGDALAAEAAINDSDLVSLPLVTAAGQAVEECGALLDTESDPLWDPLRTEWPGAGTALLARVRSLLAVDQAALVVAATNLDNRVLVGRQFEAARAADAAAAELETQIRAVAASVGVDVPSGETLYRWNPPDH
ncbi:MAG: hypothetical protein ACKOIA_05720 [Acidimicrobiia bacterium]